MVKRGEGNRKGEGEVKKGFKKVEDEWKERWWKDERVELKDVRSRSFFAHTTLHVLFSPLFFYFQVLGLRFLSEKSRWELVKRKYTNREREREGERGGMQEREREKEKEEVCKEREKEKEEVCKER